MTAYGCILVAASEAGESPGTVATAARLNCVIIHSKKYLGDLDDNSAVNYLSDKLNKIMLLNIQVMNGMIILLYSRTA